MAKVSPGSVQQLDKSKPRNKCRLWRLCVHVDGVRHSKRFRGSVSEAKAALAVWRADFDEHVSNSLTFAQYAEHYCSVREQSGNFRASTNATTRERLNAFNRTRLRDMRMDEIKPSDIEAALIELRETAPRKRLSGTSLNGHFAIIRAMFRHAERMELISRDPTRHVMPPKMDTKEKTALSPLEIELLLNRLDDMQICGEVMAVYLMLTIGLRRGEALALAYSDIRANVANVHSAMSSRTNTIGPTKSAAGVRSLPLPQRMARKLEEWTEFRQSWGISDAPTIACRLDGRPMKPYHLQQWWTNRRDGLGCAGMTLHQLRHSNLSMMARAVPSAFDLQRWAGWADIAPARIYIHTDMDALTAAAASVLNSGVAREKG